MNKQAEHVFDASSRLQSVDTAHLKADHGDTKDAWLSEPQLRQYLGYSTSTLARLRTRGLPCIGQYRLRRYHLPSVLQWLAEQT